MKTLILLLKNTSSLKPATQILLFYAVNSQNDEEGGIEKGT